MEYISHPLIAQNSIEKRMYQFSIAMRALEGNTLVVIPTGLGKTAIGLLVAASRLYNSGGKVVMLAPTKPLVEQHLRYFKSFLRFSPSDETDDDTRFAMFTGEAKPGVRTEEWRSASMILATPQVVKNDIIAGRYDLSDVTLLIVDEAHRAVGNYAYVFLAERYMESATDPLILAMTASPGGNREKISDIVQNLRIDVIETRNDDDPDVKPYIHEKDVEVIYVDLPAELKASLNDLYALIESRLDQLKQMGFYPPERKKLSMKALQELNVHIQQKIAEKDAVGFAAVSIHAECLKLRHAIGLAESQGCLVLKGYLQKLHAEGTTPGGTKASRHIAEDPVFVTLLERCEGWEAECHPKLLILPDLVQELLTDNPETKIIIFATYRDTVKMIVDILGIRGIGAERFVGQATKDNERGLSQKKQIAAIQRFKDGEFRVLVATSVGEEGLDIPSTDVVIFFEPVPSEIRSIQRRGRTGRHATGRILVLVTRNTSDEASRYISLNREKAMVKEMRGIGGSVKKEFQSALSLSGEDREKVRQVQDEFFDGPSIGVDDREMVSKVVEYLSKNGARISLERLAYGDYRIGSRILVERKTTRDFVDSLIERDLLEQVRLMAMNTERPVLIIEGDNLFTQRDIQPNAIRGALAAIAINFGVSLFYTADSKDTADLLTVLARREEERGGSERGCQQKKPYHANKEMQEVIIAAYPEVGLKYARSLLQNFGTIQNIINAEKEELQSVAGIGMKKAERIYELSRFSYL